jgi:hypothetical protein
LSTARPLHEVFAAARAALISSKSTRNEKK